MAKLKPVDRVEKRFKGVNNKPRLMKKIMGYSNDGSTADWEDAGMVQEGGDDDNLLRKRARSKIRSMSRNRSIHAPKKELSEIDQVKKISQFFLGWKEIEETL